MPIIHKTHLARARSEREMAGLSAVNVERIIHNKLAELHLAAGNARSGDAISDGGGA
jgi:hypothetical protein